MNGYEDTDYLLQTAAAHEWVGAVVGWAPLDRPQEAAKKLKELTRIPILKGIRYSIHDEEDPDWIVRDEVIERLKTLGIRMTFDFVGSFPDHLSHIPRLKFK